METEIRAEPEEAVEEAKQPLRPENQRMLELLQEWRKTPLTPEEIQILDDLEEDRKRSRRQFYGDG